MGSIVTIEMVYWIIFVLKELASADESPLLVPEAAIAPRFELAAGCTAPVNWR